MTDLNKVQEFWRASMIPGAVGVDLWVFPLDSGGGCDSALLSSDERARRDAYVFTRDADRYVGGRAMLRRVLGRYAACAPEDVTFAYGAYGKPRLVDSGSGLDFNLSHCDDLAVLAVSMGGEIGVDVERERCLPDLQGLIETVCSAPERTFMASLTERDRYAAFWRLWTAKESLLKAEGWGFQRAPSELSLRFTRRRGSGAFVASLAADSPMSWRLFGWEPAPGYTACLAWEARRHSKALPLDAG